MKLITILLLLTFVNALNLYSAFSPAWSRHYFLLPIKSDSRCKVTHGLAGGLFLLCVLLLIYAAIIPRG